MAVVSARPSEQQVRHYIDWLIRRDHTTRATVSETVARVAVAELGGVDRVVRLAFPCGHEAYTEADHDLTAHPHWCPACQPTLDAPDCNVRIFYVAVGGTIGS